MSDYWLRRAIEDEKRAHRNAQATNAELKALYQRQYKRIYAQMERLYGQVDWGDGEMITRTQLWEYSRWKDLEKELRQFATETPRIGVDKITDCLDRVFRETIGVDVGHFGADQQSMFRVGTDPRAIINTAWSGESFSARLWKNTGVIAERIRSDMEDMLVSGRGMSDIKKRLMEDFSVSYNDAARLVDTETSYVMNNAAVQRYRSAGLRKVRWCIAPEDGRECEICKSRANKVWHIDTAPTMPAHPRCRCVWQGVVELPGEYVPCDGEGETAEEAKKYEAPKTVKPLGIAPETLQNQPESGIIKTEQQTAFKRILDAAGREKYRYLQTDTIQQMSSAQEIAEHFRYTDKWGDECSPIDESFSRLKLDVQKEAAEGIEWARQTYGLKELPNTIRAGKLKTGTMGTYRESERILTVRTGLKAEEAFATTVHEMTHYADQAYGHIAPGIVAEARKNLKFTERSPEYKYQKREIVGMFNVKDADDPHELVAYSLERYATNKGNDLAREISRIWLERIGAI